MLFLIHFSTSFRLKWRGLLVFFFECWSVSNCLFNVHFFPTVQNVDVLSNTQIAAHVLLILIVRCVQNIVNQRFTFNWIMDGCFSLNTFRSHKEILNLICRIVCFSVCFTPHAYRHTHTYGTTGQFSLFSITDPLSHILLPFRCQIFSFPFHFKPPGTRIEQKNQQKKKQKMWFFGVIQR